MLSRLEDPNGKACTIHRLPFALKLDAGSDWAAGADSTYTELTTQERKKKKSKIFLRRLNVWWFEFFYFFPFETFSFLLVCRCFFVWHVLCFKSWIKTRVSRINKNICRIFSKGNKSNQITIIKQEQLVNRFRVKLNHCRYSKDVFEILAK